MTLIASDLVNTSTTLNDPKQRCQWLFVIAGSISVRSRKSVLLFLCIARAVD